jgi:prepilin-type processing-associated H-X9-DG protein
LYDSIDFNWPPETPGMAGTINFMPPWQNPARQNALPCRTLVPGFLCPSDGVYNTVDWPGQNNYAANQGTWLCDRSDVLDATTTVSPTETSPGVMYYLSKVKIAELRDGTQTTAVFSERVKGTGAPDSKGDMFLLAFGSAGTRDQLYQSCIALDPFNSPSITNRWGWSWCMGENCCTSYNHVSTPNTNSCAATGFPGNMTNMPMQVTASSYHPEGVNVCMGDGSVRFVSNAVNLDVWRGLGTRASKEFIPDF